MTPLNDRSEGHAAASTAAIRAAFPALERRHNGHPVAYFDGPGGTQVPRAVVEAMADYLLNHNANTHWAFPTSAETDAALAEARRVFADFLGASADEIAFGPNMTSLTFRVSRAIGRRLTQGDAIVVTELDHHANVDPWRALERDRGVVIRQTRMIPETGQLDWDDLDRCLSQHRTKVLAIGAASNALGTINDIPRAVAMAHEADALAFVDAVHFAPHQLIDVRAWGCDFLACSAYKFYGPHVGVLYGRRDLLRISTSRSCGPPPTLSPSGWRREPRITKGSWGPLRLSSFSPGSPGLHEGPARGRIERRRHDQAGAAGERVRHPPRAGLRAPGAALGRPERHSGGPALRPAPSAPRTPTVSLVVSGIPSSELAAGLARRGIFASHGNFYAQTVVERLGQSDEGLLRLGCACYTTEDEVERVVESVRQIAGGHS